MATVGKLMLYCCVAVVCSLLQHCSSRKTEPFVGALALNAQLEKGQTLFMNHCHKCHPHGEAGLGPAINPLPGFVKSFQIRHGVGAMPAFKKDEISKQDLKDLMAYLKGIKQKRKNRS